MTEYKPENIIWYDMGRVKRVPPRVDPAYIRHCREAAKLTQSEAADLIDVNRVTWARWESGITPPPSHHLWRYWLHVAGLERIPFRQRTKSE